jgi:hypothetical protein
VINQESYIEYVRGQTKKLAHLLPGAIKQLSFINEIPKLVDQLGDEEYLTNA